MTLHRLPTATHQSLVKTLIKILQIIDIGAIGGFLNGGSRATRQGPLEKKEWDEVDINKNSLVKALPYNSSQKFITTKHIPDITRPLSI